MAANANTPGLHDDFGPLIRRTTIAMICLSAIFLSDVCMRNGCPTFIFGGMTTFLLLAWYNIFPWPSCNIIDLSIRSLPWGSSLTVLESLSPFPTAKEPSDKLCLVVNAGMGTHTEVAEAKDPHILTRYLEVMCFFMD